MKLIVLALIVGLAAVCAYPASEDVVYVEVPVQVAAPETLLSVDAPVSGDGGEHARQARQFFGGFPRYGGFGFPRYGRFGGFGGGSSSAAASASASSSGFGGGRRFFG